MSSGELLKGTTGALLPIRALNISAPIFWVLPAEMAPKFSLPGSARSISTSRAIDPISPDDLVASNRSNCASVETALKSFTRS